MTNILPREPLRRSLRDLFLQMAGLMVAAELPQRGFVELRQHLAQRPGVGMPGGVALSVNLAQRLHGGGSVLAADVAVVMATVETCIAHGVLHWADRQTASAGSG